MLYALQVVLKGVLKGVFKGVRKGVRKGVWTRAISIQNCVHRQFIAAMRKKSWNLK